MLANALKKQGGGSQRARAGGPGHYRYAIGRDRRNGAKAIAPSPKVGGIEQERAQRGGVKGGIGVPSEAVTPQHLADGNEIATAVQSDG